MFLTSFFIVLTSLVISVLRTVFFERIEDSSTYVGVLMTFVNSVEDNILGQVETLPLLAAMLLHVVNFSVLFYKDFWGIISGQLLAADFTQSFLTAFLSMLTLIIRDRGKLDN